MEKIIIEEDYRGIEWVEDSKYHKPDIPSYAVKNYIDALKSFCKHSSQSEREHYFTIINGDEVQIIPASQYIGA